MPAEINSGDPFTIRKRTFMLSRTLGTLASTRDFLDINESEELRISAPNTGSRDLRICDKVPDTSRYNQSN